MSAKLARAPIGASTGGEAAFTPSCTAPPPRIVTRLSVDRLTPMRRLLVLAAALVLVDTMLYAALTPLLPHFLHEFGLSKSRAGILAATSVVLAIWALRLEAAPAEEPSYPAIARALRNPTFLVGLMLMTLGALLFGILGVLGPLHLAHAGWGAAAIGAVWLVGAALETVQAPLIGRMSDR